VLLCALHLLGELDPHEIGVRVGTWRHGPQRELVRLVTQIVPPHGQLLTDYLPLAVDADRHVVPGDEAGRSSLIPDLPGEQARAMHILNRRSYLDTILEQKADAVVLTWQLTEHSLISVPGFLDEIELALSEKYELVREFPASVYFTYGRIRVFRARRLAEASEFRALREDVAWTHRKVQAIPQVVTSSVVRVGHHFPLGDFLPNEKQGARLDLIEDDGDVLRDDCQND
jgi:hypothetical protein